MPDDVIEDLWERKILKVQAHTFPRSSLCGSRTGQPFTKGKASLPSCDHPDIMKALRLARKASARERLRKSRKPMTRDVLERLLATCTTCNASKAIDLRDRPSSRLRSLPVGEGAARSQP
jgi:hypothetical protein